ncbi:conserved hypothetical protein [Uncinocarpus reesii 1704]|uniref:ADP-ribosylhydrolase ARH3 n=1 Tax=Uncinocarpus reesii (strain UAMH 1704) TaxID=336963 RepID=C4JYB6_UNCRE|nr:uncharacterized protein UREG_07167 [Uncinocarpus reesii 1704]EEP82302.1 conserved hypothetical protein [Uncinocarpus reesii 1704]
MASPSRESRIKGSIFGVATVDALGGPVEFLPRGSFPKVTGYQHNNTFNVPAGKGIFNPQAALQNYIRWWKEGYLSATGYCFDVGHATVKALALWRKFFALLEKGGRKDGFEDEQLVIDGALKYENFCGNGSLMRVSPVGLVYSHDLQLALSVAARSSRVTHPYPTCTECCELYTRLIVSAMNGAGKEAIAEELSNVPFNDSKVAERFCKYTSIKDWETMEESDIDSTGYVVSTMEAALWSFFTTSSFQDGALKVVNLGQDADTVGAVYGGLAGAFYGFENIPSEWVQGLQRKDVVGEISSGLAGLVQDDHVST